jgi:hypothetical protein
LEKGLIMNVKLISYTQGTDGKNLLEQVAFAARVSNPANQNNNKAKIYGRISRD